MKILTYGSFGGLPPAAVVKFAHEHGCDYLSDPRLIDHVMSFTETGQPDTFTAAANPDKLWLCRTTEGSNGIRVHEFAGWSNPDSPHEGIITTVCVNEYDEESVKVHIATYDGAEALEPLPEFVPHPDVPGLYVEAGRN